MVGQQLEGAELANNPERRLHIATPSDVIFDHLTDVHERGGGVIEAMVPSTLIEREDVPLDEGRVEDLMVSMRSEVENDVQNGLQTRLSLGHVLSEPKLKILDGFHRDEGQRRLGHEFIPCSIRLNCTEEEIRDFRIMSAAGHDAVSFARVAKWITDAWQGTPWSGKISVVQSFSLVRKEADGARLGLEPQEVAEINEWVKVKASNWDKDVAVLSDWLSTAAVADPALVKQSREQKKGHALEVITPRHLTVIAKGFPSAFPEQQVIADLVVKQNMGLLTTKALVKKLAGKSREVVFAEIMNTDWRYFDPRPTPARSRAVTNSPIPQLPRLSVVEGIPSKPNKIAPQTTTAMAVEGIVSPELILSEALLGRMALQVRVFRGDYLPPIRPQGLTHRVALSRTKVLSVLANWEGRDVALELLQGECAEPTRDLYTRIASERNIEYATRTVQTAQRRVIRDIEKGDLRLVDFTNSAPVLMRLIIACAKDEMNRSHTIKQVDRGVGLSTDGPAVPRRIALEDFIHSLKGMNRKERQGRVFTHILGITQLTASKLIEDIYGFQGEAPTN